MPRTISSTGTPQVWGISPPWALIMSWSDCGTDDEPCMTRWVCGSFSWIASMTWTARMSPSGALVNLQAPWLVPQAMARALKRVLSTKSAAWSGSGQELVAG